jgi:hypothetical protein
MSNFISEDDLDTFEGWLKYQAVDPTTLTPAELEEWRSHFDEIQKNKDPKIGLMKLKARQGEKLYGVAVREGDDLWLVLWVRRNKKGEYFVMVPQAKQGWDPHTSYNRDGKLHSKSFNRKHVVQQRQSLTGKFRGTETLGAYGGYGPKSVGATCDPSQFSGVLELGPGVLGPSEGLIIVDLVEPNHEPQPWPHFKQIAHQIFDDDVPWIVIRIGTQEIPDAA